jgi:hypothetical protein
VVHRYRLRTQQGPAEKQALPPVRRMDNLQVPRKHGKQWDELDARQLRFRPIQQFMNTLQ